MANLPEESRYDDGVYQLELTDPVVGGPNGVSNAPLRNLANRTRWLKDQIAEMLQALQGKAPMGHVGTGGDAHLMATRSVAGFMSPADKVKLDGVATGAQANAVASVAGKTGAVALVVGDVSGAAPKASPTFSGEIRIENNTRVDLNETGSVVWVPTKDLSSSSTSDTEAASKQAVVNYAAPKFNPRFSGTVSIEAGTTVDFNHERGAKVYVPAKKIGDITAPEAVSKFGLTDYAAPKVSPVTTGGMTVYGGTTVYGGATFSGTANVTAPRPANTDDSFKVATTNWVRQAMASIFEAAGFRIETRKSVTPGTFASPPRPIQSSNGDCGMIALPSFLGGLKFVWVNCSVNRHTGWREVMWIRPMNEVFTGGASAFAVNDHAVSIHPLPNCVRLSAFHRLDSVTDNEPVGVYAWAIGR